MKKSILLLSAIMFVLAFNANAQNDTMYVMKAGVVVGQYNVNTEVDSVIFYQPQTQTANTFTDSRDGTVYQTVTIGEQVWMAENLKYLPSVVGPATGSNTTPYYYVYDYDGTNVTDAKATTNYDTCGVLYNWPAAMNEASSSTANPSGVQGVCPTGWHLPSDAEWFELANYLGGDAGGKLKATGTIEAGTGLWYNPNTAATNETGFTALPGGARFNDGAFSLIGGAGCWWSSTELGTNHTYLRRIQYDSSFVHKYQYSKESGFSVRCVMD